MKERIFYQFCSRKNNIVPLLDNLALCIPVLGCKQEIGTHVKGIHRADIIALGAEDTLGDIDPDPFCLLQELDGMGRADLQA